MSFWRWLAVQVHVGKCQECRHRVRAYRLDREQLKQECSELPQGLDWERLSAEMSANIRVGLAAGECVAPRTRKGVTWGWRPVAIGAGATAVLAVAFWLNLPATQDTEAVGHALERMVHGGRPGPATATALTEESGPVVEASPKGVTLKDNGNELRMPQGEAHPVSFSVDGPGSASARYVEDGQVTITSVYVQ
jgi:hypothetical protein